MHSPPSPDRERQVLDLWERGAGLNRWDRDTLLLQAKGDVPLGLGARNASLLALRARLFEPAWQLKSRCPACDTDCEFEVDCQALAAELDGFASGGGSTVVHWAGRRFELRAPTVDDLQAVSAVPDPPATARRLLNRCISSETLADGLNGPALDELDAYLERLEPGAIVSFALRCPACDHGWSAAIDVGEALWAELQHAAERFLIEVDALARAYGWTERDVFHLSPTRRAAYLQLVGAS
jgi:hypothetical protein